METKVGPLSLEPSGDEPMSTVFSSSSFEGELEALTIKGVLDSNGIPAIMVGSQMLPSLEFQVQVPEHLLERARSVIEEAQASGPEGAIEGEAAGEAEAAGR